MVTIFVFGYKELFMQIFGSNLSGQSTYLESYFEDNLGMLITVGVITFFLFFILMIVNYLYPVFYMRRLASGENKIRPDDILGDFKNNAGRIGILCLGMMFIVTPLVIIVLGICYALILIIIGLLLILLVYPTIFNVTTFLMFDYFNTKRGFFESLSYAMRAQFSYPNGREKSPFWKYWGATLIIFLLIYVITTIFSFIPMMFLYGSLLTNPSSAGFEENPFAGSMGIFISVMYGVSLLLSFILFNVLYVNIGLMYYDSRTDLHQEVELAEIDTIGSNE
ncbi:DUF4013 domain-containing protein [Chryseobacterium oryctis]|uniref:DUF4013 domain-containing protein n=1 Tax=Chryseobacterium oryctis TaxID=2952618 RepID=A0ABT3HQF9_9FLAO|nr:DUF4013 domain-containing protein [Chryseobacterium oryctis]MCW3162026.1 DUF4013 domain-containing protein [Chryseobacterium oryctis]